MTLTLGCIIFILFTMTTEEGQAKRIGEYLVGT